MKSFGLIVLSVILSVSATPLGDRVAIRRHNGVPLSRRYVLQRYVGCHHRNGLSNGIL